MRRLQFPAGRQASQNHCGAGHRYDKAQEDRRPDLQPEPVRDDCRERDRDSHLNPPTKQDRLPKATQPFERELETNAKQEKDDPDLRQHLHQMHIVDEAQRGGTDHHPGENEACDGGHAQTTKQRDYHDRCPKNDDQVF